MLVKVVAVQARLGEALTLEEKLYVFKQRPDFVCLPEYYLLDDTVPDFHRAALHRNKYIDYLKRLSDELSTSLIAGTVVEAEQDRLYNTSYVVDRGDVIGWYRKRNPVPGELARGINPGEGSLVMDIRGVRIGLMICGDVFYDENYREMADQEADLVFIPTTSPFRPADSITRKKTRDQKYFVAGAEISGAYVVKVCGVGKLFGSPLQGRSLIAAPWQILAQTQYFAESDKGMLTATLDLGELREFRAKYRRATADAREAGKAGTGRYLL
jgi:predicted amidohydrolase